MATSETYGVMGLADEKGDLRIHYPITHAELVTYDGKKSRLAAEDAQGAIDKLKEISDETAEDASAAKTAASAQQAANTAKSTAESASTAAANAQKTATEASSAATSAQKTATDASTAAASAQQAANTAKSTAESASTAAANAQKAAQAAQASADGGAKIATGNYTGTGTKTYKTEATAHEIPVGFKPKVILISTSKGDANYMEQIDGHSFTRGDSTFPPWLVVTNDMKYVEFGGAMYGTSTGMFTLPCDLNVVFTDTSFKFYITYNSANASGGAPEADVYLNKSNQVYRWIAIG